MLQAAEDSLSSTPITQIEMHESGRMAMNLLADRMRNPHRAALATTMVASHLVERDSVRDLSN